MNTTDMKKISAQWDMSVLVILTLGGYLVALFLHVNVLVSLLLIFVIPAIYISLRTKQYILRVGFFTLLLVIPYAVVINYLGVINNTWYVNSIVPFRLYGVVSLEDIFGMAVYVYSILIFYHHFFLHKVKKFTGKRVKIFELLIVTLCIIFGIFFVTNPAILIIPYFYFSMGLVCLFLPTITFLYFHRSKISSYIKTTSYFFICAFLYELLALHLGYWSFPGKQFIGWIFLGKFAFPFEELFFWMTFTAGAMLTYYEFFDE